LSIPGKLPPIENCDDALEPRDEADEPDDDDDDDSDDDDE